MISEPTVLIVDDNPATTSEFRAVLMERGLMVDSANEGLAAMEKLQNNRYKAVVLDPVIRYRLNGYAVLHYIELQQPEMLSRVFLLSSMSRQTIARTAPALVSRLFRKPSQVQEAAAAVIASVHPPGVPRAVRPKRSALLVEDDSLTAMGTSALLEQLGYACEWLPDGGKVLETVSSSHFDLIVLDLIMPDVDGFTVLARLSSRMPHLLRRVVVMTGMPEKYLEEVDRARIRGIVRKPLDIQELQRLMDRCTATVPYEGGGESPAMT